MGVSVDPYTRYKKRSSWNPVKDFETPEARALKEEEDRLTTDQFDYSSEANKKKKQEEVKRKADGKLKYRNLFERVGDIFEANSPQDIAFRKSKGLPEKYLDQKNEEKQVSDRAKNFDYAGDEIKKRKEYFAQYGIDIEKSALQKRLIDSAGKPVDSGSRKVEDKAKASGINTNNDFYKKLKTSTDETANKRMQDTEKSYQNYQRLKTGQQGFVEQQARRFIRGAATLPAELPSNTRSFASNLLDVVSPEGSRVDKFAESQFKKAAESNAKVKKDMELAGFSAEDTDNPLFGAISEGVGSLALSAGATSVVGVGAKAPKALSIMGKLKHYLKPGVVGSMFGINEAGEITREAKESGASDLKALAAGTVSGGFEAVLENWGLSKLFGATGGVTKELFSQALTEGSQEFLQDITTSGVMATYKDVDWGDAIVQALQSGGIGAIIGGGAGIGVGLSNNLQEKGVPQDVADATGMRLEDDIKNNFIKRAEQGMQEDQPPVVDIPVEQPTAPITETPSGQQPQVVSHITRASNLDSILASGLQPRTPMQLDDQGNPTDQPMPEYEGETGIYFEKGNKDSYKYPGEDNIKIIMEQGNLPNAIDQGEEISVQENILPTPENVFMIEVPNQELADKLDALGYTTKINPNLAAESTTPPKTKTPTKKKGSMKPLKGKKTKMPTTYDNAKPTDRNYPTFEPAEFSEDAPGRFNTDDYVIDTDGRIRQITSGNEQWFGGSVMDDWNRGYLRAKYIGNKDDSMTYANHIRLATKEEIAKAKDYKRPDNIEEEPEKPKTQKEKVKEVVAPPKKKGTVKPIKSKKQSIPQVSKTPKKGEADIQLVYPRSEDTPEGVRERIPKNEVADFKTVNGRTVVISRDTANGNGLNSLLKKEAIQEAKDRKDLNKLAEYRRLQVRTMDKEKGKELIKYVFGVEEFDQPAWRDVLTKSEELAPKDVERALLSGGYWTRTRVEELLKLVPGLKENPVLTYRVIDNKDRNDNWGNGYFEYDITKGGTSSKGRLKAQQLGITEDRLEASGIKDGDTVDFGGVFTSKGKLPALRKDGVNYSMLKEENPIGDEKFEYKTDDQLDEMTSQLNQAAQSISMLRQGRSKSKKFAGAFYHFNKKTGKMEHIKLTDAAMKDPRIQVRVLAHELSHGTEYRINGDTGHTLDIFGELTKEEKQTIIEELKAVTLNIEGQEAIDKMPEYFNKRTELLARFVEQMVVDIEVAQELAPTTFDKYKGAIVRYPDELGGLMDAINGKITNGLPIKIPRWYQDLRQAHEAELGDRAGRQAYKNLVVARAKAQVGEMQITKLLKDKFKNVKDDQKTLFRAAESVKETIDGEVVYGTRDFISVTDMKEGKKLQLQGYEFVKMDIENGKEVAVFAKARYTPEQAKAIFESLSPEGQQLIKDFTETRQEAKDLFNRKLMKELFKIDANLEGWVHRGLRDPAKVKASNRAMGKRGLKRKIAGMKRKRSGNEDFLEDFQKQMTKALLEGNYSDTHNNFIIKQFATISKPIATGMPADEGWTEVTYSEMQGILLPGEGGRDKMTIQKIDKLMETESTVSFLKPQQHYQVPTRLAKYYKSVREVYVDKTKSTQALQTIAQYWAVNVLVQGGTVGTNAISGGLQYGAKVINDTLLDVLHADPAMSRTRKDIAAIVQTLMPRGWTDAPDYVYGGYKSNLTGQFMYGRNTPGQRAVNKYADWLLMPFSGVESYWKKVIITSEGAKDFKPDFSETEMASFKKAEEEMLFMMNEMADRYGFDYNNVAMWITNWNNAGGTLVKPFIKWPFKYAKFVTGHAARAVDKNLPWQERTASIMTLTFMVALFYGLLEWRDREKETPDSTATKGRVFLGKLGVNELFVRVSKYPFVNISAAGRALVNGQGKEAFNIMQESVGSIGPLSNIIATELNYRNQYDTYKNIGVLRGQYVSSFIPGFRLLSDIGNLIDNKPRKPENFQQAIGSLLPLWGSEDFMNKWRGEIKQSDVPDTTLSTRQLGKNMTMAKQDKTMYRGGTALSATTGIYTTRVNPEDAKLAQQYEERKKQEKEIRALLDQYKYSDAKELANKYDIWISKGTYRYYRSEQRKANK
jgi:hypothetical protein